MLQENGSPTAVSASQGDTPMQLAKLNDEINISRTNKIIDLQIILNINIIFKINIIYYLINIYYFLFLATRYIPHITG